MTFPVYTAMPLDKMPSFPERGVPVSPLDDAPVLELGKMAGCHGAGWVGTAAGNGCR
jgi:hypothetical protein